MSDGKKIISIFFLVFLIVASFAFAHSSTPNALLMNAKAKQSLDRQSKGPLIVLDAGHGGSDEGANVRSVPEKKITLAAALYTKKQLEEMGYKVILTRGKDTYVSLPRRVAIANKTKSALFVSIHFNSSRNSVAEGIEVYYYGNKDMQRAKASRRLANDVLHHILDQTEASSRGVKSGNFHVIRETTMPAILIEGGFMTNYAEWQNLKKRSYLESMAKGIAQGIDKYLQSQKYVLGAS